MAFRFFSPDVFTEILKFLYLTEFYQEDVSCICTHTWTLTKKQTKKGTALLLTNCCVN